MPDALNKDTENTAGASCLRCLTRVSLKGRDMSLWTIER